MKKRRPFKTIFLFLLISLFVLASLSSLSGAQSIPWEYYSKYKIVVPFSCGNLAAKLSFKVEARFRDNAHYYNKIPVGISAKVNNNWEVGLFYALKNKKNKGHWDNYHLIWPEATFHISLSSIAIDDRQRIELHLTDRDQRYRNFLRIKFSALNGKLIPWIGNEARYFFKRKQIAMNEVFIGLIFKPCTPLSLNVFYDYRTIKKQANRWESANVIQTQVTYNF